MSGEALTESLTPFDGLLKTLRGAKWDGYPSSSVNLAPYLQDLEPSQLVQLAEVLPASDASRNLLRVAQQIQESGDLKAAAEVAERLFHALEVHHWFRNYDGGTKRKALAIWSAHAPATARAAARKQFARELGEELYSYQSCVMDLQEILDCLFDEMSGEQIWPMIEDYLLAAFPEIADATVSPTLLTAMNGAPARELGVLIYDYCVHPASVLSARVSYALLHGVVARFDSSCHAIDLLLHGSERFRELGVAVLAAARASDANAVDQWRTTVEGLGEDIQLNNRLAAMILCESCGWVAKRVSPDATSLPSVYGLEIPLGTEIIDPGENLVPVGEPVHDTNNPRELLKTTAAELRALTDMSGIPLGTLYHRAKTLMEVVAPQEEWSEAGERRVMEENKSAGIALAYRRPRGRAAWSAVNRMAAELLDAGRIAADDSRLLGMLFRRYDPDLFLLTAQPRPDYIRSLVEDEYLRREGWLEAADASHVLAQNLDDARWVVAEATTLAWLTHGGVSECRETGLWVAAALWFAGLELLAR